MNISGFYKELENSLPKSTSDDRKIWASTIIREDLDIKYLSKLVLCKEEVASRFLWLLSEIGEIDSSKLFKELPFLLDLNDKIKHVDTEASFANYWLISGVPIENEAKAIDLMFTWIQSADVNVTAKSRSLFVLFNLTKKYPELKNELKICLEDQMDKNTKDFSKRVKKILNKLEQ